MWWMEVSERKSVSGLFSSVNTSSKLSKGLERVRTFYSPIPNSISCRDGREGYTRTHTRARAEDETAIDGVCLCRRRLRHMR